MEDCEEYTVTFNFYVISGSNLSQVHMVVENLEATEVIPMKEDETAPRRAETPRMEGVGHNVSPNPDRRMTTSRDTS